MLTVFTDRHNSFAISETELPARELAEDLELALRELLVDRPVRAAVVDLGDQELRHRRAEVTPAGKDHVHRLQQVVRRALLAEEAVRARAQHVDRVLPLREAGQDQHPRIGITRAHVAEDVHAAAVGHADVEDQELPGTLAQPVERLLAGRGLTDLADRGVLSQHLAQACPYHRMVICDQNPRTHHGVHPTET